MDAGRRLAAATCLGRATVAQRERDSDTGSFGRTVPRPFEMRWGGGFIVEEAGVETPYAEPTVQLLEYEDGALALRFCYYHGTRFGRGPMMVGEEFLESFADGLRDAPRIRELLKRMVGD